ncbi:MAG: aldo/keto reductase [Armatimonadetes bacterium]|nr:aldo/keto reductase [Armatimonadota bacterium]
MEYRQFGRTGVMVSPLCMGTMTFGWHPEDWGSTKAEGEKIGKKALDLGINFFDTANVYDRGGCEEVTGKVIGGRRDEIFLATKYHGKMGEGPNDWGNSRRHIIAQCDASLKRLGTDYIDLYQAHRPQPSIPIDETLRALDDLIRTGKVRYIGSSTFAAWQVCEAHYIARELGLDRFVSEQPPYNLLDRRIERELLPFTRTYNYAVIPWSPLAGGQLSGKYLEKAKEGRYATSDPMNRINAQSTAVVAKLKKLADKLGISLTTLSMSWVINQPGITSAIIGARKISQFDDLIKATELKLDDETLKKIDEIIAPGTNVGDYYDADFGPNALPM